MTHSGSASATHPLHLVVELLPKDASLETAALAAVDPASPAHRAYLTADEFAARYGRSASELQTVAGLLRATGARDVYVSRNRLLVGATMTIAQAERAFHTKFGEFVVPGRTAFAPVEPLTLPVAGVRAVRGVVGVTIPRLADVPKFTDFRGNWYVPQRFRAAYDATNEGGNGQRVALIEASADRLAPNDIDALIDGFGAPPGASASRVQTEGDTTAAQSTICGRDDRGQEPTVDADAILTMAPLASVDLRYEDVCEQGDEGVLALQRALDASPAPTVIAFPFVVAPLFGTSRDAFGPPPIPYLEAALRGIPVVVPAGDDGAYGMRLVGMDRAAVTYPCVLPFVICAGGTELGDRSGVIDEGPWNDGVYATGGGISADPRPSWQIENEGFEFSPDFVKNRLVPDVSADASGHLMTYWHGYQAGGVGGTSESTALVAAQLAAINAQVPGRAPADLGRRSLRAGQGRPRGVPRRRQRQRPRLQRQHAAPASLTAAARLQGHHPVAAAARARVRAGATRRLHGAQRLRRGDRHRLAARAERDQRAAIAMAARRHPSAAKNTRVASNTIVAPLAACR